MSLGGSFVRVSSDLRGWLEGAISDSNAALPFTASSSNTEAVTERSGTAAESSHSSVTTTASSELPNTPVTDHTRKLVTARRIRGISGTQQGHKLVVIDGWNVVAKHSESKKLAKGRYVLFFEPDSFLPAGSDFEDLFSQVGPVVFFGKKPGYRVGTTAWTDLDGREIFSQGCVFDLTGFPDINKKVRALHWEHINKGKDDEEEFAELIRGIDFSEELGVVKWESIAESTAENMDENLGDWEHIEKHPVEEHPVEEQPTEEHPSEKHSLEAHPIEDNWHSVEKHPAVKTTTDTNTTDPYAAASLASWTKAYLANNPQPNPSTPSFILKTSMERVQNCPNLFTKPKYQRFLYQESLKLDGASITIYFVRNDSPLSATLPTLPGYSYTNSATYLRHAVHPTGRLGVCTRNQDLLPHHHPSASAPIHTIYWTTALAAKLDQILPTVNRNIAIQAELVGAQIQSNPYGYPKTPSGPTHELFIYSITDLTPSGSKRWHPRKVETFAMTHGLKHVPVLGYHTIPSVARDHEDLIARAELKKGEGLVYKNCVDGRWFKILSSRWIVEKGDEMRARAEEARAKGLNTKGKGGKGKGKGKGVVAQIAVGDRPKGEGVNMGWQMSKEETEKICAIFANLEESMRKDESLRAWMVMWERLVYGDAETRNVLLGGQAAGMEATSANSAVPRVVGMEDVGMETAGVEASGVHSAANHNRGQDTRRFALAEAKRQELVDWLGLRGSSQ